MRILLMLALLFVAPACSGKKSRMDCVDECRAQHRNLVKVDSAMKGIDYGGNVEMHDVCRCE